MSSLDKAQLLYNHIWFSTLAEEYVEELYTDKRYRKIIDHSNFNPRLISFITDSDKLTAIQVDEYWSHIQRTLDNPADIWAHVFDAQLDAPARALVALVVLNGRQISEQLLRAAFGRMAARVGTELGAIQKADFDKSVRITVRSLLNRTLDAKTGIVQYDLYNPAIGDFALKKYTSPASLLHSILGALETAASLNTLKSMKVAGILRSDEYLNALRTLVAEKLGEGQPCSSLDYQVRLADLAVTEPKLGSDSLAVVSSFLTRTDFSAYQLIAIKETTCVLIWAVDEGVFEPDDARLVHFAESALDQDIDHDEYVVLSSLIALIQRDEATELEEHLKRCVEDLWRDSIDQRVIEEGVLDDYCDLDDVDRAYEAVEQFVTNAFEEYGIEFDPSEIYDISTECDVVELISENREAAAREDYEYDSWRDEEPPSSPEVDPIDDLFDRR